MTLPKFGRKHVRKAGLKVRKTGDGLSEMLRFAPVALFQGDEVNLVVRGVVIDVQHPSEDRKNPVDSDVIRVHIVDATEVALVQHDDIEPLLKAADEVLAEFRRKEALEEEQAAGITRLPGVGDV